MTLHEYQETVRSSLAALAEIAASDLQDCVKNGLRIVIESDLALQFDILTARDPEAVGQA